MSGDRLEIRGIWSGKMLFQGVLGSQLKCIYVKYVDDFIIFVSFSCLKLK